MAGITQLLTELLIDYEVTGDEAFASCPFHSPDKHPSWSVNVKSGLHHCFSCGARGNLAHLVSYRRDINYTEAVIYVNEKIGWSRSQKWREDYEAKTYAPQTYRISEADMGLFTSVPEEAMVQRKVNSSSVDRYGIRWKAKRSSWIFPIRDPFSHELWGWQEKNNRIFRNIPAGIKKSKTLFGLQGFDSSQVYLVESPIDAARLDASGFSGGLSSWGASVSLYQLSLIQSVTEHLVVAFDNDKAGREETHKICKEFKGCSHISVFNYGSAEGKDPGELSDDEVRYGIENAIPSMKWSRESKKEYT